MRMNQIQNDTQLENLEHQYEFNHIGRINQQKSLVDYQGSNIFAINFFNSWFTSCFTRLGVQI